MNNQFSAVQARVLLALSIILLCAAPVVFAQDATQWRRVSQEELDMKTPKVEPDADAEALFWEVRIDDKKSGKMSYNHYVRVKIFTERGREKFSKFDIPFMKGKKVEDVAARVIKPNSEIVELQPSDIFEREVVKAGKNTVRAKSFAVPGIEPGAILEYQYKETFKGDSLNNERLFFQRDIPMQRVTYFVRPYKNTTLNFAFQNMEQMRFLLDNEGFYVGTRENVPAFREEPQMPPEDEVQQWVALTYESYFGFRWGFWGNSRALGFDEATKPSKEIEEKARALTASAQSDDEKLKNIYNFVQKQIKNVAFDRSMSDEQRREIKNKKPADTLRRGMGDMIDLDLLFAALAKAAGFDVNAMFSGNRERNFFNYEKDLNPGYLHFSGIAVRRGNGWLPFDPSTPMMPYGMTFWHDELISTMIAGGGGYTWIRLPMIDHTVNLSRRTGKFKLTEDGTLEGTLRVEHGGHQGLMRRVDMFEKTPNEREELIKNSWKQSVPTAEITNFSMENFDDPSKPYTYSFNVRVPNYAQKTGKRLFLQPGFFEYGRQPLFTAATRKYQIYFEFPWSEDDQIEIELPKNFEADSVEAPGAVVESNGVGSLVVKMDLAKETNVLKYNRQFFFGAKGKILFPATAYKPIKTLFDSFERADAHTISLKAKP